MLKRLTTQCSKRTMAAMAKNENQRGCAAKSCMRNLPRPIFNFHGNRCCPFSSSGVFPSSRPPRLRHRRRRWRHPPHPPRRPPPVPPPIYRDFNMGLPPLPLPPPPPPHSSNEQTILHLFAALFAVAVIAAVVCYFACKANKSNNSPTQAHVRVPKPKHGA